jgi:hypothetical protein
MKIVKNQIFSSSSEQTVLYERQYGYKINEAFYRHRDMDLPAIISRKTGQLTWYKHNEIIRSDGPALIDELNRGFWLCQHYSPNSGLHRSDGPAVYNTNYNALINWYLTDDQTVPKPNMSLERNKLSYFIHGREITLHVMQWQSDNNIPNFKHWTADHRLLFKLTFG